MDSWKEDHLNSFDKLTSQDELFSAFERAGRELGFEYCAYGLRSPLPISQPKILMMNNYPSMWNEQYSTNNYVAIDPTVRFGLYSSVPMLWSEELFSNAKTLWTDAREAGLRYGWAQAVRNGNGSTGLITLARSSDAITMGELQEKELNLSWLANVFHSALANHLIKDLVPEVVVELTKREAEVLKWAASGKTNNEIAFILGISDCTVSYHLNNAMIKLNCNNKVSVTVKAVVLGLIS